jgi:cell division protein FtsI (penicillin-binding protein 3)
VHELAPRLGLNETALKQRIHHASGAFMWVKRNVPLTVVNEIKAKKWPGVGFKYEMRRHYPNGAMATHLLGLVGIDGHGLSGVEQAFESTLSADRKVPASKKFPRGPLQLTIDARYQTIAEKELDWGARKIGAKRGLVLIQDCSNGEILSMASWPTLSLDPDNPSPAKEMRMPALMDVFEPGSTFKIVMAAAALEERVVKEAELFNGEKGAWKVLNVTIHDHEPQKQMTLSDIMTYSSNVGSAKIGERLGANRLYQYARLFGFGVLPGCGIGGEAKGQLRTPNQWSGVSKYTVAFGQEVSVTALQMIGAYSAIANGGTLMEPRLIKNILDKQGDVAWEGENASVRRVVSPETAQKLTQMLTRVVDEGTGVPAQIHWNRNLKVAGKTGTAQKYNLKTRRYDEQLTLVSFCGFFPADKPRVSMLVILDEPEGRRWGGADAAPVFRRIAEQILPLMDLNETLNRS